MKSAVLKSHVLAAGIVFAAAAAYAQGGPDICGGLDLSDGGLADCRRQYDEAQSDAARAQALDTFRERPTPHYSTPTDHPRAPARFMTGLRSEESGCERWALPVEAIAKCRTQMKAARTDDARARILARYQALANDLRKRDSQ